MRQDLRNFTSQTFYNFYLWHRTVPEQRDSPYLKLNCQDSSWPDPIWNSYIRTIPSLTQTLHRTQISGQFLAWHKSHLEHMRQNSSWAWHSLYLEHNCHWSSWALPNFYLELDCQNSSLSLKLSLSWVRHVRIVPGDTLPIWNTPSRRLLSWHSPYMELKNSSTVPSLTQYPSVPQLSCAWHSSHLAKEWATSGCVGWLSGNHRRQEIPMYHQDLRFNTWFK